jgi:hypothetical protein
MQLQRSVSKVDEVLHVKHVTQLTHQLQQKNAAVQRSVFHKWARHAALHSLDSEHSPNNATNALHHSLRGCRLTYWLRRQYHCCTYNTLQHLWKLQHTRRS